jgi:ATP/maltotriose-dependent transcriptional regulator MalT
VQDWVGAAQLVESQFCNLLNSEDFLGIKRRLSYFPEGFIITRPGLLLMQAWIAHFGLRLAQLHTLTTSIQAMLDTTLPQSEPSENGVPSPGFEIISHKTVQAHIWALKSVYLYFINQGSQAMSLSRQAVDILPEFWMFARGNAMIYLGLSMFMEGQYHQTVELFKQAYESLQEPGTTYGTRLLFTLAVSHLLHGELELCRQTAEQMLRNALTLNLLLMQGWSYYLLGRVYQEWNQLELAVKYYQLVVDQRFTSNLFCSLESVQGYVFVLHILGRHELAQQSLDSLQQLLSDQVTATPSTCDGFDCLVETSTR